MGSIKAVLGGSKLKTTKFQPSSILDLCKPIISVVKWAASANFLVSWSTGVENLQEYPTILFVLKILIMVRQDGSALE